ncbi:hypothetical protein [Streptomyces cyanogenus]|uniref:hypothetical protein n=1 Tax=Streptomyces cyanogenus TaxID=80860 RepID=UPI001AA170BE|nr:hypothetical protein [Streptomyces cyanogenus]
MFGWRGRGGPVARPTEALAAFAVGAVAPMVVWPAGWMRRESIAAAGLVLPGDAMTEPDGVAG